jgi:hypothetical protein
MKNTIFLAIAALFFSVSLSAQSTVDSIASKYKLQPMPEALTVEKAFPALGTYQLAAADGTTQNVTISMDQNSKGIVWVEGLPEGKFKAYLRKSPATYRILAQKSEAGKSIPEGTLIFNPETNTLNIALGKAFDEADPAAIFGTVNGAATADVATAGSNEVKVKTKTPTSKSKTKVQFYTATKAEQATTTSVNTIQQ